MKTVCFNKFEKSLRDEAHRVITDPAAPSVEKHRAREVMRDTLTSARERFLRLKARKELGPAPERKTFSTEQEFIVARSVYRDGLDRLAAEEVLDSPASPLGKRHLAKKILREIEQRERLRGAVPVPRKPERDNQFTTPAPQAPEADTTRSPEERAAIEKFFGNVAAGANQQAQESDAPVTRPEPQTPQLFCEVHQTLLSICGCNEVCPLCLQPRQLCGHKKEKK
jgi:hypothetical protein